MTHRTYDLVTASVELDLSGLEEKLDELEGGIDESRVLDIVRDNAFVTEDDVNNLGFASGDDLDALDDRVGGIDERVQSLEQTTDGSDLTALQERIASLEAALQTAASLTGDRLDRLEATSNTAYNFFALAGKMISLLLNGSRS